MTTPDEFGSYLRARREARRLGLRQLARMVRISPSTLSQLERDFEAHRVGESVLLRLAGALGEDPDHFLALAGRIPSDVKATLLSRPDLLKSLRQSSN